MADVHFTEKVLKIRHAQAGPGGTLVVYLAGQQFLYVQNYIAEVAKIIVAILLNFFSSLHYISFSKHSICLNLILTFLERFQREDSEQFMPLSLDAAMAPRVAGFSSFPLSTQYKRRIASIREAIPEVVVFMLFNVIAV